MKDREAKRAYDRAYHAARTPEAKARKIALQADRQRNNLRELRAYKAERGCADCGESDPIVLEFDHRDPSQKDDNIGDAYHGGWSLSRLLAEAAKCDVVCANCHRRRTAAAFWGIDVIAFPANRTTTTA
jgi:hypothetical protein